MLTQALRTAESARTHELLEHYGSAWGGWNDLLAKWQANRDTASQLRVYDMRNLVPSAG